MCLALLPLCYGGGVAYTPFLALSLGYSGYRLIQSPERGKRLAGGLCLFFTLAAFLLLAAYLNGYKVGTLDMSGDEGLLQRTPRAVVKSTLRFLAVGFGPAVRYPAFPTSGIIAAGLVLAAIVCLAASLLRRSSAGHNHVLGLSCFLMGCLGITVAAGYSRATFGDFYLFGPRYAIASVPTMLGIYFVWEICGPRPGSRSGAPYFSALPSARYRLTGVSGAIISPTCRSCP